MLKVVDQELIQKLNEFYISRYGFGKTGIELKRKAWFVDQTRQLYCLQLVDEKGRLIPRMEALCKIPY